MTKQNAFYATGRRKTAIARVWMMPGSGNITINKRDVEIYFVRPSSKMILRQPLEATESVGKFDIFVNVNGGGLAGQAGAIRLGITRALMVMNGELRPTLKKAGFVTRDDRKKERKKYGQRGARARFQYSKR